MSTTEQEAKRIVERRSGPTRGTEMTKLITAEEIGQAWENIEADWPAERFQDLKRYVKDTLHDAQFALEAYEAAALAKGLAAGQRALHSGAGDLLRDMQPSDFAARCMGLDAHIAAARGIPAKAKA